MIVFDLSCDEGHSFEGWFRNADDYSDQLKSGLLTCPQCGSNQINKKPSASHLNLHKPQTSTNQKDITNTSLDTKQLQNYIVTNFEDVGREFRNEALKMHYGEKEKRNIKGEATLLEAIELTEEGVEFYPVPGLSKQKLN